MNQDKTKEHPKMKNDLVVVKQDEVPLDGSDTSNEDTIIQNPFDPTKIRVDPKQTQMDALIKRLKNTEINLSPDFQRKSGIWKDGAQSRLIESMLIKIPLPAFYMDASDEDNWIVVDGLQRLTALKRFVVDQDLALTGLEFLTDYNNKRFDDLPRSLQRRIEETDIVLYLIQPGTPNRVKFDIFRRINTGGEPLSPQEIRHALNQGQTTKFLKNLANSKEFKEATDEGVSPKRMDDRECVLRFLAFSISPPSEYKEDNFDSFLNDAMATINQMKTQTLNDLKIRFKRSMKAAHDIFGKDAFRKRYEQNGPRHPINKALFEAWSVNLDLLSDKQINKLVKNRDLLINCFITEMNDDYDFEKSVSQGTGSTSKVKVRFNKIEEIINEALA